MTKDLQPAEPAAMPAATEQPSEASVLSAPPSLTAKLGRWLAHPIAPFVTGGVLLVCVVGYALKQSNMVPTLVGPAIVLFDPVKFVNAQRAAASIMALAPSASAALTLTQVAKQAEAVIREEANGALVLVKQSVVAPDGIPEITDAVLERFGLPTQVPTVTIRPGEALEDIAPTDSAFSSGKLREDYRLELQNRTQHILGEESKKTQQKDMVP